MNYKFEFTKHLQKLQFSDVQHNFQKYGTILRRFSRIFEKNAIISAFFQVSKCHLAKCIVELKRYRLLGGSMECMKKIIA